MSLCHFTAPRLHHLLLFTSLLLVGGFNAHTADEMLRKAVGKGAYEVVCSQQENALWVATSQSHSLDKDGIVYRLDPTILDVMQIVHNDLKPSGAAINHAAGTLWFSNTVDSTVTAIDAKTGAVKGHLALNERQYSEAVRPLQPRKLAVSEQTNTVYITGLGKESVVRVVDGATLKLKTTITNTGVMAAGLAINPQTKRLYITNADGELLTIDSKNNTTVSRKKLQNDNKTHFYLNLSFDTVDHHAFITGSKQSEALVVDTHNSEVLEKIATPESPAVLFNPTRNEAYVTYRKAGEVGVINGKCYKVAKTSKTPTRPNSLTLSDDGKTLYVSAKQVSSCEKEVAAPDNMIRIAL